VAQRDLAHGRASGMPGIVIMDMIGLQSLV